MINNIIINNNNYNKIIVDILYLKYSIYNCMLYNSIVYDVI